MTIRDRIESAAIGGATGLAIVATYIVARTVIDGANSGDWLNFAGVIFGVMLTIAGTTMVEHLRHWINLRQARQDLVSGLQMFIDQLQAAEDEPTAREQVARTLRLTAEFVSLKFLTPSQHDTLLQLASQEFDDRWQNTSETILFHLRGGELAEAHTGMKIIAMSALRFAKRER